MIKTVTDATFEKDVLKSDKPVLVDFWAPWCQPCLAMEPALKELSDDLAGKAEIAKLNVDDYPEVGQRFDVMSIPNMVLFKNGQPVDRIIGATSKDRVAGVIAAKLG